MISLLLWMLGCVPNPPGLLFIHMELQHIVSEGVLAAQKCLYWKKKKQLTTQQYSAWIAREKEKDKKFVDQCYRLSHWMYPTLRLSTEQCSGLGVMFKLPWSGGNHVFWTEPNVYEMGAPLFLESEDNHALKDNFYRFSLGIGYRYLMNPSVRLGIYGYYDYTTQNELFKEYCPVRLIPYQFLHHPHIFNAGVEIFTPLGGLIGNLYGNSTLGIEKGDVKYVIDRNRFTFAIGGYYGQRSVKGMSNLAYGPHGYVREEKVRVVPINLKIDCYGIAFEGRYRSGWKTHGIKYTYDKRNKHRLSYTMQWELLYPFALKHGSQIQSCLMPTERYLESSQNNAIAMKSYWKEAVDRVKAEHMSKTRAPQIRDFRHSFVKKYNQPCDLNAIENYALKLLKTVPDMKDTAVLLEGSSQNLSHDSKEAFRDFNIEDKDFKHILTKSNQLQKLYTTRSVLHNIGWVAQLRRAGLTSVQVAENEASTFSRQELRTINKFAATSHYFTPFQVDALRNWNVEKDASRSWIIRRTDWVSVVRNCAPIHWIRNGSVGRTRVGITYYVDTLGDRLVLLEKIAREVLPYYEPRDIPISRASIISMQYKLNEAITSNLHWQCTAALCSDFSQDQRKVVFKVSRFPRLPYEIKQEILQYVVKDLINLSDLHCAIIQKRLALLKQDLQLSNESEGSYEERLYCHWASRLLSYLSSIETVNDYREYLAIPENPYGILF